MLVRSDVPLVVPRAPDVLLRLNVSGGVFLRSSCHGDALQHAFVRAVIYGSSLVVDPWRVRTGSQHICGHTFSCWRLYCVICVCGLMAVLLYCYMGSFL